MDTREAKLMMQSTAGLRFNDGFFCPIELPTPLTFDHHDYSLFQRQVYLLNLKILMEFLSSKQYGLDQELITKLNR